LENVEPGDEIICSKFISNAETTTARMHSQPERRKNPKVVQSRRPNLLLYSTLEPTVSVVRRPRLA